MLSTQLTVGICAFNEGKNIANLLENILHKQEIGVDSEVLVVCSGCTDNTPKIAQTFALLDSRVKVAIETQRRGKASAVNYILEKAKGQTIIFVSADTIPQKGCFTKLLQRLHRDEFVGIVCGSPVPINTRERLVGRLVNVLWCFHNYVFSQLNEAGLARHATEVFCIRNGIVERIPNAIVNDDAFIAVSSKKKGWLIKYEKESVVSICGPATLREYFSQRCRIMYGHYQLKKVTGEPAQHLMYLAPIHPLKVLKFFVWLIKEHDLPTVGAFLIVELIANLSAILDALLKKSHSAWAMLPSTKDLTTNPY